MLALVLTYGEQDFISESASWPESICAVREGILNLMQVARDRFKACGTQDVFELPEYVFDDVLQVISQQQVMLKADARYVCAAQQFSFWI